MPESLFNKVAGLRLLVIGALELTRSSQTFYKKSCSKKTLQYPQEKNLESKIGVKNRLQHWCFPVNIAKFLEAPILKNIASVLANNCERKKDPALT